MALDGAFLSILAREIWQQAKDTRVDKIYMPAKEEVVLFIHSREYTGKLFFSIRNGAARVNLTAQAYENPASPPMFCMLLRKHLIGGRLISIEQKGLERVLYFRFSAYNEFSEQIDITFIVEIMGNHSNLILVDGSGRIIDALNRVNAEAGKRILLPGAKYEPPPQQDKINIIKNSIDKKPSLDFSKLEELMERLAAKRDYFAYKALMENLDGASPIVCRELEWLAANCHEVLVSELLQDQWERLKSQLSNLCKEMKERNHLSVLLENDRPADFSYIPITQYGNSMEICHFDSASELLDFFYSKRDQNEKIKYYSQDILKALTTAHSRISKKLELQKTDLKRSENREKYREYGELIIANIHAITEGTSCCEVDNYYDPALGKIRIQLDPMLTPSQNAQRYFKKYRKAEVTEQMMRKLIDENQRELTYLDTVFDALSRAKSAGELQSIREELIQGHYLKAKLSKKSRKVRHAPLPFLEFKSSDHYTVLAGRNNKQNDDLTLKSANKRDIWLHVKDYPGAHVIVSADGKDVPERTLKEAAIIAACHSKVSNAGRVAVDYTQVRHVHKPAGARPGMVIYNHYKTVYVEPDKNILNELEI